MDIGYIPLSRKFFEHELWQEPRVFSRAEAFADLLRRTRFEANTSTILVGVQSVEIRRGEVAISLRYLSRQWQWSKNKVDKFLKYLEKQGMIEKRTPKGTAQTIIKLCNFDKYNPISKKSGQQTGHERDSKGTILNKENNYSSSPTTARAYEGENDDTRDTAFGKSIEEKEKSCAKKEKELTRLPADAIEYIRIEQVADYLKSDQCWLDALCMNRHLRMDYVLSKIDEFAIELKLQGEIAKDKQDCKRHFNNWLRKNRNRNEPTTGHRTSNGDITNDEVMQRCQDRVLQRLAREKAREMGQYDDAVADPF